MRVKVKGISRVQDLGDLVVDLFVYAHNVEAGFDLIVYAMVGCIHATNPHALTSNSVGASDVRTLGSVSFGIS